MTGDGGSVGQQFIEHILLRFAQISGQISKMNKLGIQTGDRQRRFGALINKLLNSELGQCWCTTQDQHRLFFPWVERRWNLKSGGALYRISARKGMSKN